jgi:hypothetical protein
MFDTEQSEYCLSIASFDESKLQGKFREALNHRNAIKEKVTKRIYEYQVELDKQYEHIFNDL